MRASNLPAEADFRRGRRSNRRPAPAVRSAAGFEVEARRVLPAHQHHPVHPAHFLNDSGMEGGYFEIMSLTNLTVAEEALSLSPVERANLAKLLIQSLEGDPRSDDQIKAELADRLERLKLGEDPGLTFEQVFEDPLFS